MKAAAALALLLATAPVLSVAEGAAAPPKKASVQEINDQFAAKILKSIAGHETEPAEQVFMDIRIERLKSVPAAQFINIYPVASRGVGVVVGSSYFDDFEWRVRHIRVNDPGASGNTEFLRRGASEDAHLLESSFD